MRALLLLLLSLPAGAAVPALPRSSIPAYSGPALVLSAPAAPAALIPGLALGAPSLNRFWDGVPAAPEPAAPVALAPLAAGLDDGPADLGPSAPWLVLSDPRHQAALERALDVARATRAGRKALAEAGKILAAAGRELPVDVRPLGRNFGEYDYVERRMNLHEGLFRRGRETELAGTIVHELIHVVQHAQGVPSNALEMELEAHLEDLDMLAELGLEPRPGTFARQAWDALREGPEAFTRMIQAAVPGTVHLGEQDFDDIEEQLEQDLEEQSRKQGSAAAGLARAIENDLDLLRTPEGRASYKAFSRRVKALLKRRAAQAK